MMSGASIPVYSIGRVSSFTDLFYRLQIAEFEEHFAKLKESPDVVWVSALTMCPLKWFYMLRYPEIAKANIKGSFILGKLVHLGLQQLAMVYARSLGFDELVVERDVEKVVDVVMDGVSRSVRVSGRIDLIGRVGDEYTVIEVKTARSDVGIPHEHHMLQLRIYMNMVRASRGVLLYITPDRIAEYEYRNPISDEELQKLVASFLRFEGPRYSWECGYCQYAVLCPRKVLSNSRR